MNLLLDTCTFLWLNIKKLPLEEADTLHKATLPNHHKDPFEKCWLRHFLRLLRQHA